MWHPLRIPKMLQQEGSIVSKPVEAGGERASGLKLQPRAVRYQPKTTEKVTSLSLPLGVVGNCHFFISSMKEFWKRLLFIVLARMLTFFTLPSLSRVHLRTSFPPCSPAIQDFCRSLIFFWRKARTASFDNPSPTVTSSNATLRFPSSFCRICSRRVLSSDSAGAGFAAKAGE